MKNKRIIPCLDITNGRVVKGKQFKELKDIDDPLPLAKLYDQSGADELIMYDITATTEGTKLFIETIEEIAKEISIPLTVGGGIASIQDISRVLQAGANKVSLNSAAIANPSLINEAAATFGSNSLVVGIDVKQVAPQQWHAFTHGGTKDSNRDVIEWAKEVVERGAGELVINSMDNDGMKKGFNIPLLMALNEAVSAPMIASGGAGSIQDFLDVFKNTNVSGALAASVFHYGEVDIPTLNKQLLQAEENTDIPLQHFDVTNISFDEQGLIPAIVQHAETGDVLMLAYMNEESLRKSIQTKQTWFYSRSRNELWNKGATSGNTQVITKMELDCDSDSILVNVLPSGPACHTGENSCFSTPILSGRSSSRTVLYQLAQKIAARKINPVEGAYTTYLFNEGIDKILKKIGEETSEVIIGAKNNDNVEVTWEISDLVYHMLVLMEELGVSIQQIQDELLQRHISKEETRRE